MKTKPFSELRKRMSPGTREKSEIITKLMLFHINLLERQESWDSTQDDLRTKLNDVEMILSKLENQEDIQLSTLYNYINALGIN